MAYVDGKNGTVTWTSGSYKLSAVWFEHYDKDLNRSRVWIRKLTLYSPTVDAFYLDGKVKINGTTVITANSAVGGYGADCRTAGTYDITNTTTDYVYINHDNDGKKSIDITLAGNRFSVLNMIGLYTGKDVEFSGSKSISLTTIPRASSITSASNVTLGNKCSIKWTPNATNFTYKLKFTLGNFSYTTGTISPKSTSAYTYTGYTIPLSVANNMPKAATGTMTATLSTYSDTTLLGSATKNFTVTVPSTIKPTLDAESVTVSLDNSANSVINDWGVYVAGYSKAKITASAKFDMESYGAGINFVISGGYSATKAGTKDTNNVYNLSHTGGTLTAGTKSFTVQAKDTRGRVSESSKTISDIVVYPYSKPNVNSNTFIAGRNPEESTQVIVGYFDWDYSDVGGHNKVKVIMHYKEKSEGTWSSRVIIDETDASEMMGMPIGITFKDTASYDVKIEVVDLLGNSSCSTEFFIPTAAVLLNYKAGGKGLGIGKTAESNAFEVGLDSIFFGEIYISDPEGNSKQTLKDYIKAVVAGKV